MELETMFVEQKWNILRELSYEERSPLQLSETLGTSMANISQQLRLLEAARLVGKRKIKNRDKGKPRSLFSLTDDYGYVIAASKKFAKKQLIRLTDDKKAVMQIWFVSNEELHHPLLKLFCDLNLKNIDGVVLTEEGGTVHFYVCPKKGHKPKGIASKHKDLKVRVKGIAEVRDDLKKLRSRTLSILYDPTDAFASFVKK